MNLADLTQVSVRDFAEELGKIEIKKIEIPKFSIPNWPKDVAVSGHLGKRDYCIPVQGSDNLLAWKTGRHRISFMIDSAGMITFKFAGIGRPKFYEKHEVCQYGGCGMDLMPLCCSGNTENALARITALILFDRFKVEVLAKILVELKSTVPVHNQVVDAVMKAFEPFIPFVVADQFSG